MRGASHSGRLYRENLRGHLLFLWKHRGREGGGARAPRCCSASLRAARARVPRRARARVSRRRGAGSRPGTPRRSSSADDGPRLYFRLAFATAVVLSPGLARSRARSACASVAATLAWSLVAVFARARSARSPLGSTLTLTLVLLALVAVAALVLAPLPRRWPEAEPCPRRAWVASSGARSSACCSGSRRPGPGRRAVPSRARPEAPRPRRALARPVSRVRRRQPASRATPSRSGTASSR